MRAAALRRLDSLIRGPVRQRKPRRHPEQEIQRAVFEHLDVRGMPNLFAFHPANGGYRSPVEAAILTSLGVRPGISDVIIIYGGKVWALELKARGGRFSREQLNCREHLLRAGATVGEAYILDEALAWLEAQGLVRGHIQ
jgi:hypothetical protein